MFAKTTEKEKVIALRKTGKTYSEIMKIVPVAKSTVSFWLKEVGLSVPQKQLITEKRRQAQKRGALARRAQRLSSSSEIISTAAKDIALLSEREVFLIGIALYWAEGSKQKEHNVSQEVDFGNSDPRMIQFFLRWLDNLGIPKNEREFSLYIHKTGDCLKAARFWALVTGCDESTLRKRIYFKKGNPKTKRRNTGEGYNGLLRIRIQRSTNLNRKIFGWVQGIVNNWGVV